MKLELKKIGSNNLDFIALSIDHGINSIKGGETLVPFIFMRKGENNNDRELYRFLSDSISDSIKKAEEYINEIISTSKLIVLVYNGVVGSENKKKDAIIAKVWLKGNVLIFAQPYIVNHDGNITIDEDYLYLECQ